MGPTVWLPSTHSQHAHAAFNAPPEVRPQPAAGKAEPRDRSFSLSLSLNHSLSLSLSHSLSLSLSPSLSPQP